MSKIYDVHFNTTYPMCIAVEADSPEEAEKMIREDDGTILDKKELLNRFATSLDFNMYFTVSNVEEVG